MNDKDLERYVERHVFPSRAVLFDSDNGHGIALRIGENLSKDWQSGDVIVFWPNGEQTAVDGIKDIKIINDDIYTVKKEV